MKTFVASAGRAMAGMIWTPNTPSGYASPPSLGSNHAEDKPLAWVIAVPSVGFVRPCFRKASGTALSLQERVLCRGSRGFSNGGDDGVAVVHHKLIAEPDHHETVALDLLRPRRVVIAFRIMLLAVQFDDEFAVHAEEIHRIAQQRHLSAEPQPVKSPVA